MSESKGKKNGYLCRGCGWRIITVNRDEGVTPFMIGCQNDVPSDDDRKAARESGGVLGSRGCGAYMESAFYRVLQSLEPSHEWYAPDKAERKRMRKKRDSNLEHVARGGLILRRISDIDGVSFFNEKIAKRKAAEGGGGA